MSFDNLEEFLKQKKAKVQENEIDWTEIKKDWLLEVENLLTQVQNWLKPLKDRDLLKLELEDINIEEEYLGSYGTKKLHIIFPDESVVLKPIGRNIIGASGRIDMVSKEDRIKILRVNKEFDSPKIQVKTGSLNENLPRDKHNDSDQIEWEWKIATNPPKIVFLPFNEDSFSDTILRMISEDEER